MTTFEAAANAPVIAASGLRDGIWHRLWPWLAALATGALLALSFPPADRGGLIWIALTPLICAVWFRRPRTSGRRAFLLGWVAGIAFFTASFFWLRELGLLFRAPILQGIPLLLALYLALYPAIWAWFLDRILVPDSSGNAFGKSWRNLLAGIFGASAWTALEWVRGWLFGGFGWNGLGVALHRDLPMIQIADITGVPGLTWLVAFANLMLVIIVRRVLGELGPAFFKRIRWEFSLSVLLVGLVFAYGVRRMMQPPNAGAATPLSVAMIQANIPQDEKFDPEAEDAVMNEFRERTALAEVLRPDLIVWPESSTPRGVFADRKTFEFVTGIVVRTRIPLLFGTVLELPPEGTFNGAVLLPAHDENPGRWPIYKKRRLVPFGEYLPLRPLLGWAIGGLIPGDFLPGKEYTLLPLEQPAVKIAALVCFEDTDGELAGRFSAAGADLLVNLTNDGWFGHSPAARVHLANSIFRAVETRRPLLRCCNTGITASILPTGAIAAELPPFRPGMLHLKIDVPVNAPVTFYARHGDWIAWLGAALASVAIVFRSRLCLRPRI